MHEQAQVRLRRNEVEKAGAAVYVVLAIDLHRTSVFKERNLLLSTFENPFKNEEKIVYATALSDPAGRVSAIYGVSRKCLRWGSWVENHPRWFVIDCGGTITYEAEPSFSSSTSYQGDVDRMLEALRKAAQ